MRWLQLGLLGDSGMATASRHVAEELHTGFPKECSMCQLTLELDDALVASVEAFAAKENTTVTTLVQ